MDTGWAIVIAAAIPSVTALVASIWNQRQLQKTHNLVEKTAHEMNSIRDALVNSARAEGILTGAAQERQERKDEQARTDALQAISEDYGASKK